MNEKPSLCARGTKAGYAGTGARAGAVGGALLCSPSANAAKGAHLIGAGVDVCEGYPSDRHEKVHTH